MIPDLMFIKAIHTLFRTLKRKKKFWKGLLLFVLIGFVLYGTQNDRSIVNTIKSCIHEFTGQYANNDNDLEKAKVERVVDGDTIVVILSGKSQKIRMIGIDCPESVHPDQGKNSKAGKKASEYTKEQLKKGRTVYLQKDVTDKDKYGRLLRYVWITEPGSIKEEKEVREKMYNAILVREGYAIAKKYRPDVKYAELFEKIQRERNKKK